MSKTKLCENPCETCKKEGLPILLTRYAVMPEDTKAPKLSGQFGIEGDISSIAIQGKAQYGLRLLRSGYVYVYDEARKRLDEYFVTEDGFLSKVPMRQIMLKNAMHKPAADYACARNGLAPIANCITIPKPKYATNIWIGYCDTPWTNKTYQQHYASASLRSKHMRKITISGSKVTPQKHTAPIEQVSKVVAEYNKITTISSFSKWSPFSFNKRFETDGFKTAIANNAPKGGAAVVALDDPVGINAELVSIINHRLEKFMSRPDRRRGAWLESQYSMLENGVKHQAREQESAVILAHNEEAKQLRGPDGTRKAPNPRGQFKYVDISETEAKRRCELKAKLAWDDYLAKINNDKRNAFNQKLQSEIESYTQTEIKPLIQAYEKWTTAPTLISHFKYNYDTYNIRNGEGYIAAATLCVLDGQQHPELLEIHAQLLSGDIADDKSIFIRAMVYNQQSNIDMVAAQSPASVDNLMSLPWDSIIGSMKDSIEGLSDTKAHVPYLTAMAGGIGRCFSLAVDKALPKLNVVIAASMASFHPPYVFEFVGSRRQFRASAIKWAEREFGVVFSKKQMRNILNTLEIYGEKLDETGPKRFMIIASPDTLDKMPLNLTPSEELAWVKKHLTSFDAFDKHFIDHTSKHPISPRAVKMISGTITPYGLSVIAGVLQVMAYKSLLNDEKAKQKDSTQHTWRLAAGGMAIAGAVGETLGAALEQFGPKAGRYADMAGKIARVIGRVGKALGALAGIITGVWDMIEGVREGLKGNLWLGLGMFALGFAGAGVAIALYYTWIAVFTGFVAVLIIIAVSLAIMFFKDNALQDWLERTQFGVLSAHTYADQNQEQAAFKLAMAEMRG